jgi:preprotein translocase subunit SecF
MWQMAWMWSLIPTSVLYWVINLLIVAGLIGIAAGWIGKWIPFVSTYAGPAKIVGIILLVLGVYFKGGYSVEIAYRAEAERLQKLVEESEKKSEQANIDLAQAVKDREAAVNNQKVVIQERIKIVKQKIDADCRVDIEAIDILNDSAKTVKAKKK